MTSVRDSVGKTLLGEKLASIRRVTNALEIETKTGRVVHVARTADGQCLMAPGPAADTAQAADPHSRAGVDLTAEIPFAFDNRPIVISVESLQRGKTTYGCVIGFSGGGQVAYQLGDGQPELVCTPPTTVIASRGATVPPKYSLPEIERRWTVAPDTAAALLVEHPAIIRDKYLADTHLRLRHITATNREETFKLCKKYGTKIGATQAISNLYLSDREHRLLDELPGTVVTKARHPQSPGSIDVYTASTGNLFMFEVEFSTIDEAAGFKPPAFVDREITEDTQLSGHALAALYGEETLAHTPATDGIVVEAAHREDFAAVLELNESAIPHVSPIDMAALEGLATQSVSFTVARDGDGVVAGFLLVLADGEDYASLNYRYFVDRYPSFAYVDRIVVHEGYRGAGIGSRLYSHLLTSAVADKPVLACEVNLRPPNPASVAFHEGLGFVGVGEQDTDGGSKRVLLMVKELG